MEEVGRAEERLSGGNRDNGGNGGNGSKAIRKG